MLDERLRDRVTFMMNTNISPVNGFRWNGCHYTLNDLTGQVHARPSPVSASSESAGATECASALSDQDVRSTLQTADRVFEITAAYFHQRKASGPEHSRTAENIRRDTR